MITQKRLKELLLYDSDTGVFVWIVNRGRQAKAGDIAGCVDNKGYIKICVDGKRYKAHRLAWLYMTGEWPVHFIDHKDHVEANNRFSNLRDVTRSVNGQNQKCAHRNNKSGLLGVAWNEKAKKWRAEIHTNGSREFLGYFPSKEIAHEAYLSAKRRNHEGCTI